MELHIYMGYQVYINLAIQKFNDGAGSLFSNLFYALQNLDF